MTSPSAETGFLDELKTRIRAGCPLTYIVTREEGRLIRQFETLSNQLGRKLWRHTLTQGLSALSVVESDPFFPRFNWETPLARYHDPIALLDFIAKFKGSSTIFLLIDFHEVFSDGLVRRKVKDLVESLRGQMNTVFFVSPVIDIPAGLSHEMGILHHPLPGKTAIQQSLQAIQHSLAKRQVAIRMGPDVWERVASAASGLTLQRFEDCVARHVVRHGQLDGLVLTEIVEEKKARIRSTQVLELVTGCVSVDHVGGLQTFLGWLKKRQKLFTPKARLCGLPYPKGVLMLGVPGCGKSLAAKACAAVLDQPLVRMDIGRLFAPEVGRSEANLREALDILDSAAPCVLWVDEIEKALAGLGGAGQADGGTALRVYATLLSWLQERQSPVFMVATANAAGQLPPELFRKGRWDDIFFVDLPSAEDRQAIFSIHLKRRNQLSENFDLAGLARAAGGYSGAEIEQAVVAALVEAFHDERPLQTSDILQALSEQVPLSQTMPEDIAALRAWAANRARRAGPGSWDDERNPKRQRKLRSL